MSLSLTPDPTLLSELTNLFDARLEAELADAARLLPGSDRVPAGGDPRSRVMLVKGIPGPAEECGSAALSGPDGKAATLALEALGLETDYFAVVSRPTHSDDARCVGKRLRAIIETIDPWCVIALDGAAADDTAEAFGATRPGYGRAVALSGRIFVAVDGLEASLSDSVRKSRVWAQLKALSPRASLW